MLEIEPVDFKWLEAAQQLVIERGFSATTVDAILEAAGASKGAFFEHFSSKAALRNSAGSDAGE